MACGYEWECAIHGHCHCTRGPTHMDQFGHSSGNGCSMPFLDARCQSPDEPAVILDEGIEVLQERDALIAQLRGRRVRVTRVVVFEGLAEDVALQLAQSLPEGVQPTSHTRNVSIRVVQGPMKIIGGE